MLLKKDLVLFRVWQRSNTFLSLVFGKKLKSYWMFENQVPTCMQDDKTNVRYCFTRKMQVQENLAVNFFF